MKNCEHRPTENYFETEQFYARFHTANTGIIYQFNRQYLPELGPILVKSLFINNENRLITEPILLMGSFRFPVSCPMTLRNYISDRKTTVAYV